MVSGSLYYKSLSLKIKLHHYRCWSEESLNCPGWTVNWNCLKRKDKVIPTCCPVKKNRPSVSWISHCSQKFKVMCLHHSTKEWVLSGCQNQFWFVSKCGPLSPQATLFSEHAMSSWYDLPLDASTFDFHLWDCWDCRETSTHFPLKAVAKINFEQ